VSVVSGHWCLTELPPNILSMYMLCDSIGLFFSLLAQSFLTCSDFLFFSVGLHCLKILKVSVNLTCTTEWRFALVCPRDLSALASVEAVNVVLRFCRTLMHLSPVHSGQ
jgi:hypothetical protein